MQLSKELEQFIEQSGSFRKNAELKNINWFQVGGQADLLFKPKSLSELQEFLRLKAGLPIFVLGVGSNVIIRDGGFKGCVIRLGRAFTELKKISATELICGAANLDVNVAKFAAQQGIAGLEFLSGVPGTIGGALKMNAGAYGGEVKDILLKCQAVDLAGNLHEYNVAELNYSYRKANLAEEVIFTEAHFKGNVAEPEAILAAIKEIQEKREASQPIRSNTGGSTFKNPEGHSAWQLIDAAGCRGLKLGAAQISELHCNFMLNLGGATASDLEQLGETVIKRVKEHSGVTLQWEIKRIGSY